MFRKMLHLNFKTRTDVITVQDFPTRLAGYKALK
jgi:hypothetical protein